jgi:hypothetical protein
MQTGAGLLTTQALTGRIHDPKMDFVEGCVQPLKRTHIMRPALAVKTVECKCGHTFESTLYKSWCQKCCRPVFYNKKDQRRHGFSHAYLLAVMMMVLVFITYLFVEMVAKPLLSL